MPENIFEGGKYISAADAALRSRLSRDYVARLARDGKIVGKQVGRQWYVSEESLNTFLVSQDSANELRRSALVRERKLEQERTRGVLAPDAPEDPAPAAPAARTATPAGVELLRKIGYAALGILLVVVLYRGGTALASGGTQWLESFAPLKAASYAISLPFEWLGSLRSASATPIASAPESLQTPLASSAPAPTQSVVNNTYNTYNTTNNNTYNTTRNYSTSTLQTASQSQTGGVTEAELETKLSALADSLEFQSYPNSTPSSGGAANNIALSQNIDNLNGTHLSNITVDGVSGLQTSDIPDLSSEYLSVSGGTLSGALNVSSTTATSTFADGIDLSGGCFSVDGTCITAGASGSSTPGGASGAIQYNDNGTLGGVPGLSFDLGSGNIGLGTTTPSAKLTVVASTTDSSPTLFDIAGTSSDLFSVDDTGAVSFLNATGNSATTTSFYSTTSSSTYEYSTYATFASTTIGSLSLNTALAVEFGGTGTSTAPGYGQLLLGNGSGGYDLVSTSSLGILAGGGTSNISTSSENTWSALQLFSGGASTTNLSVFQNAWFGATATSSFNSAGQLSLAGLSDSILYANGAGQVGALGIDSSLSLSGGTLSLNLGNSNSWSALQLFSGGLFAAASSTIGNGTQAGGLTISGGATTTGNALVQGSFSVSGGTILAQATTSNLAITSLGNALLSTDASGSVVATTSISTNLLTGTLGVGNGGTGANTFSYGLVLSPGGTGALTTVATSSLGLLTTNVAEGANLYFTNARAQAAISVSGLPLTYTSGVIGISQANGSQAGYLSSTDWSTFNNKVSSTSLSSSIASAYEFPQPGNGTSTITQFNAGLTAYASTTIGNGSQTGGLTVNGAATTTGTAYFAGDVGIGTSTPASTFVAQQPSTTANPYAAGALVTTRGSASAISLGILDLNGVHLPALQGFNSTTGTSADLALQPEGNNVGIGTSTFATTFNVAGSGYFTGAVGVGVLNKIGGTLQTSGAATIGGNLTVTGTGTSTFSGSGSFANLALTNNSGLLKAGAGGYLTNAIAGTDYLTPTTGVTSVSQTYGTAQTGAITLATSSAVSFNGLTLGSTVTNSSGTFSFGNTLAGTLNNSGLTNSTIKVNGTTLTLGDTSDTITAASSTLLSNNNTFSGANAFTGKTTLGNASTTVLSVSGNSYLGTAQAGAFDINSILSCSGGEALQTDSSGNVSCGTIATGGASSGGGWTTNNIGVVGLSTSTDRVAIGATSTPYAKLSIVSGSTATTTLALVPASGQTADILDIYNTSGGLNSVLTAGGYLGLGTTSPSAALAVAGNSYFAGNLTATGTATFSSLGSGFVGSNNGTLYSFASSSLTAASSTLLGDNNTFSGTDTFKLLNLSATTSSLLSTNAQGQIVATTSIGTNLLTGVVPIANGGTNQSSQTTNGVNYFDGTKITSGTALTFASGVFGNTGFINTNAGYEQNGSLILYASSTNRATLAGVNAGGADSTSNSGTVSDSAFGFDALDNEVSGSGNSAFGNLALQIGSSSSFANNTAVGNGAGRYVSTTDSTEVGDFANQGAATSYSTGQYNSAFGYAALDYGSSGGDNTAIGALSLGGFSGLNTFSDETALGINAGNSDTAGSLNTYLGFDSGYIASSTTERNTFVGAQAGQYASSSVAISGNTFLGYQAGEGTSVSYDTGYYNTFLGYGEGDNVTSGYQNTLVGACTTSGCLNQITTGSQNIELGYNLELPSPTSSGQLDIGNYIYGSGLTGTQTTVSSGDIGLGTTTPWGNLSVVNSGTTPGFVVGGGTSGINPQFIVASSGNVGIGTTSPATTLSVGGNALLGGNVTTTGTLTLTALPSSLLSTNASGQVVATTSIGTNLLTGIIPVANGGTGWGNIAANTVLLGNGTGALSTTTRGNLTETGSSILTITGGGSALLGSGTTIQVAQSSASQAGYLSSTDWSTFNNKVSSTSLSATYPLAYNSSTGVFSTAFSTTTANTFSNTNVFNGQTNLANASSSLFSVANTAYVGNLIDSGTTANSFIYSNASGQITTGTVSAPLSFSSGTLSLGTVGVGQGGTGSTTLSGILLGNGTSPVQTLTVGSGLTLTGTTLSTNGSGITSLGPTGQLQTGGTQTLATTTSSFNGLTAGITIVGSGNTQTFTPTLAGTLGNAGLANSTISGIALGGTLANLTATNGTLTFSGTYNGGTARTIGLNLGNANSWTALQTFGAGYVSQASSTVVGNFNAGSLNVTSGTSTFANGITLTSGCVFYNGSCIGANSGTVGSGLQGQFAFYATNGTTISATSTLFATQAGNVGVGTTTAGLISGANRYLTIASADGSNSLSSIEIAGNANTSNATLGRIDFYNQTGGSDNARISVALSGGDTSNGALIFSTENSGVLNEAARIDQNGNLGIGTTSPGSILSINGVGNFVGNATSTLYNSLAVGGNLSLNFNSSLLATNASGQVVATTSIGTNLLTGNLATINGTTIGAGSTNTITAASSSLLGDNNTFGGSDTFSNAPTLVGGFVSQASSTVVGQFNATTIQLPSTTGSKINLYSTTYGLGIEGNEFDSYIPGSAQFAWRYGGPTGTLLMTLSNGGLLTPTGGFVSDASSTVVGNFTNTGTGTFGNIIDSGVTANTLLYANASKQASSVTLPSYVSLTSGTLAIATSSLGLGNDTFLGLSDTIGSYNANRILYEGSSAVTDNSGFTFNGTTLTSPALSLTGGGTTDTAYLVGNSSNTSSNFETLWITGNQSTANTGNYYGIYASPGFNDSTPGDTLSTFVGGQLAPNNSGAGTVTSLVGLNALPQNSGTGTSTTLIGVQGVPENSGSGTTTSMYGFYSNPLMTAPSSGAVTREYGIYTSGGNNSTAGGTVGSYYGAYLGTPAKVSSIGTEYGLYQQDSAANNYFAGDVGVATTTPWAQVSIVNASSNPALLVANSSNTAAQFIVASSGNVGVGTSTPLETLGVDGTIGITGTGRINERNGDNSTFFQVDYPELVTANAYAYFFRNTNTTGSLAVNIFKGDGSASIQTHLSGGTASSYLNGLGGNVGIGTTTPGSLLSIGTTNGINFSTATSTFNSTGGINLASGCFAIGGNCLSLGSFSGTLGIANGGTATSTGGVTNGVEYFNGTNLTNNANFVFNGTNVGVGTTTPWGQFAVSGNVNTIAAPLLNLFSTNTGAYTTPLLEVKDNAVSGVVSGSLASFDNASGNVLTILNNGNVGIGTSSPSAFLTLADGANTIPTLASYTTELITRDGSTGNSNGLSILSGAAASDYINFGDSAAEEEGVIQYNNSTNELAFGSNGSENLYLSSAGNVGVGTTTPWQALSVSGNLALTGALYDSTASAGGNGSILESTGSATKWTATSTLGLGNGSFLGLSDTISSYNANRVLYEGASSVTDNSGFTFNGSVLAAPIFNVASNGSYEQNGATILYASSTNKATLGGINAGGDDDTSNAVSNDSAFGYFALADQVSGDNDTALGAYSLQNGSSPSFVSNTAVGTYAGRYASSSQITAVGVNSNVGTAAYNSTGQYNTSLGYASLQYGSTGGDNTAIGPLALNGQSGIDTFLDETALGFNAGNEDSSGSLNTYLGFDSGYVASSTTQRNTFVGAQAGMYASSSIAISGNTFLGYQAGEGTAASYDSGSLNTFIGELSGTNVTSGADNILIGASPGTASENQVTTGSQNIAIGYNIAVPSSTGSGQLDIGNYIYGSGLTGSGATVSSGQIGLGTTTPWGNLSVVNSGGTAPGFVVGSGTQGITPQFIVAGNGNVGVGTTTPWQKLSIAGNLSLTGAFYDSTASAGGNGNILESTGSATKWIATSTLGLGNGSFLGLSDTISSYNANRILYEGSSAVTDNSGFTFNGTTLTTPELTVSGNNVSNNTSITDNTNGSGSYQNTLISGNQTAAGSSYYDLVLRPSFTDTNAGDTQAAEIAFYSNPTNASPGTLTNNVGIYSVPQNTGTGTTTDMAGLESFPQNTSSGTTTTMYGLYVQGGNTGTGLVSNYYGAFLAVPNKTGTISNEYGLYQNDSAANNYFAGDVGVATTTPWAQMSIVNASSNPALLVANSSNTAAQFIVASSGNVGIGTSTPDYYLTIQGQNNIHLYNNVSNTNGWFNDYTNRLSITADDMVQIGANGNTSAALTVASTSNVGIGTSTPVTALSVVGNTYTTGGLGVGLLDTTAGTLQTSGLANFGGSVTAGGPFLSTSNFGGTYPTYDPIATSFAIGDNLVSGQADVDFINTTNYPTHSGGFNFYQMTGTTTGTNLLTIKGSGNVGIGTSSPFTTLGVSGSAYIAGNLTATGTVQFTGLGSGFVGSNNGTLYSFASSSITAASSTLLGDNNTFSGSDIFSKPLSLTSTTGTTTIASGQGLTVGGSQFVVQQGSGDVGIGVANPAVQLELANDVGTAGTANQLQLYNNGSGTIYGFGVSGSQLNVVSGARTSFYQGGTDALDLLASGNADINGSITIPNASRILADNTSGTALNLVNADASNDVQIGGTTWTGNLEFFDQGSQGMTIAGSNVGVGSTTPWANLSVVNTGGTAPGFEVGGGAQGINPQFIVSGAGNVGVGTTTPGQTLSVAGGLELTGGLYDSTYNDGSNGSILESTGSATKWIATSTLGLGNGSFLGLSDTISSYSTNRILYEASNKVTDNSGFTFNGTTLTTPALTVSGSSANDTVSITDSGASASGSFQNTLINGSQTGPGTGTYYDLVLQPAFTDSNTSDTQTGVSGLYSNPRNSNAATLTSDFGIYSVPQNTGTGTTTNMFGLESIPQNTSTGTTTNMYALYTTGGNTTAGGQVTNYYSAYLSTPTKTGPLINEWGLYQADSAANNYFAGDVGIGTTTPWGQFAVSGNVNTIAAPLLNLLSTNTGAYTTPLLEVKDNAVSGVVSGSLASFDNASGNVLTILNNGDVGVATTTPWAQVSIVNASSNPALLVSNSANTATQFIVASSGNVGVGTTSPATTLSTQGNTYTTGGLGVGLLDTTAGTIQSSGNILGGGTLTLSGTSGTSTIASGQGFTVGGTQLVVQQGSGDVGVGNNAPTADLSIGSAALIGSDASSIFNTNAGALGTTAGNTLKLASIGFTASNNVSLGVNALRESSGTNWTTTAIGLTYDVDSTSPVNASEIWLTSGGNVGISTTSPATNLSVVGNTYTTGGLGVGLLDTTAGTIQSSGNILGGGTLTLSGTSGTSTIASGQGFTVGGTQLVVQQGSGAVGIGSISGGSQTPGPFQLTVAGAGDATTTINPISGSTTAAILVRDTSTAVNSGGELQFGDAFGSFAGIKGVAQSGGPDVNGALSFQVRTATGNQAFTPELYLSQTGNVGIGGNITSNALAGADMTLLSSGNVGIGTSSPIAMLALSGSGSTVTAGLPALVLSNTGSSGTQYEMYTTNSSNASGGGRFIIEGYNGPSTNAPFSIYNNDVGIGTTTPGATFAVAGNTLLGGNLTATGTASFTALGSGFVGSNAGTLYTFASSTLTAASSTLLGDNNTFSGANTFTQTLDLFPSANEGLYIQNNNLAATSASSSGIFLQNATAAVSGTQQSSPNLTLEGQGWATTGATSEPVDWTEYVLPVQAATPTGNLTWASSVNNAAFTTRMTLTSAGVLEPSNLEVASGALGSTNTTNGNIWVPAAAAATHETAAQYLLGGSSGIGIRTGFYGSTATQLTAGDDYAAVDVGSAPIKTAASGNHLMLANLAVNEMGAITAGGATITNTASLYIDGAATATVTGNNYDLYASSTAPNFFGGNLGIGTTTPWAKLSVTGPDTGSGYAFALSDSSNNPIYSVEDNGVFNFSKSSTTTIPNNAAYAYTIATSSTANPLLAFNTTSGSEMVTIGEAGSDVVLGGAGASPNLIFQNSGTIEGSGAGQTITIGNGGDVVDFGVSTFVGTTSNPSPISSAPAFGIQAPFGDDGLAIQGDGSHQLESIWYPATTGGAMIGFYTGTTETEVGSITSTGSATAYNTTSDRRLKTDISTTTQGISTLMQIPIYNFAFKSDPTQTIQQGFIAQTLEPIYPEAVTTNGDNGVVPLGATSTPWQVDYGRLTPLIIESVQNINSVFDASDATMTVPTIISVYQGTSTPAVVIDQFGDLAIGTSTATTTTDQKLCLNGECTTELTFFTSATSSTTTGATSTPTIASDFLAAIEQAISGWLGTATNGIQDLYATIVHANEVDTQELCVSDSSGKTCITRAQLEQLLAGQSGSSSDASSSDGGSDASSSNSISMSPILQVNGANPATIQVGSTYSDLGAQITGPQGDLNLGIEASVDGATSTPVADIAIDTSAPGTHTIVYSATDQNGLTGTAERVVYVAAASSSPSTSDASSTDTTDSTSTQPTDVSTSTPDTGSATTTQPTGTDASSTDATSTNS